MRSVIFLVLALLGMTASAALGPDPCPGGYGYCLPIEGVKPTPVRIPAGEQPSGQRLPL